LDEEQKIKRGAKKLLKIRNQLSLETEGHMCHGVCVCHNKAHLCGLVCIRRPKKV